MSSQSSHRHSLSSTASSGLAVCVGAKVPGPEPGVGCLICLAYLESCPSLKSADFAKRYTDAFDKISDVFKVNLTPFRFNFMEEMFPFCRRCSYSVFELCEFYEKMEMIQVAIDKKIFEIKSTLKISEERNRETPPTDVRAIIFRGQILKVPNL
jgi:hypothetical protein